MERTRSLSRIFSAADRIVMVTGAAALVVACGGSGSTSGAGGGACGGPSGPFAAPMPPDAPTDYMTTDAVVTDGLTRLKWERQVTSMLFTAADPGDPATQIAAGSAYCTGLSLDGQGGFRLPTRLELVTIQDHALANPSIEPKAFPNTPPEVFWTSTREVVGPTPYFAVSFSDGTVTYDGDIQGDQRVRCVRPDDSVPPPKTPFTEHGSVTWDERTGLVWERTAATDHYASPDDAAKYCKTLELDGCGGFRVPTAKELDSIVDDTRAGPAADPDAFPGSDGWYWSSTEYARMPGFFLALSSGDGVMYPNVQSDGAQVRCVR